ncbi:MAG: transketolase [Turicibacter sp.]|nr:transketolase [Turicibacter sp.]
MNENTRLERKATEIRIAVLKMIHEAKAGHIGGSFSSIDILTALYHNVLNIDPQNPTDDARDRFILSKGHIAEALWAVLADRGFIKKEELKTFCGFGTRLIAHPNNKVAGVEMNTGSLGQGLSVAVGMALAAKMDGKAYRTFTLMGDGEQAEGSVWEAAMSAAHYKLDNLVAIIDRNRLQISGTTEDVMTLEPLPSKWTSFGWHVVEVDGHNMNQLIEALSTNRRGSGKPTLIMANTIKTKGIPAGENNPAWHHHVPSDAQYKAALNELEAKLT